MPYRTFVRGDSDYLRSSGTPLVLTPPLWLAIKLRSSDASNLMHCIGLYRHGSAGNDHHAIRINAGVIGITSNSGVLREAPAPRSISDGEWHVVAAQVLSNAGRMIWAGDIANRGVDASTEIVTATGVTFGRRDDNLTTNYLNADVAWGAVGLGILTMPQIAALLDDEPPVQVTRQSIRHFWPMLGGSTVVDVLGGLPLINTGTAHDAGGPATIISRARYPVFASRPPTQRKLRARISIGDAWHEVKVPLGSTTYGTAIMEIDDAGDELRLRLNGGAAEVASLGGSAPNVQTGDLYLGVGLNAGAVVSEGSDAGRWSAFHGFDTILDAPTMAELQADLSDHLAPITTPATLVVPANGLASLDVSPYVKDLEQGWAITSATSGNPVWQVTVDSTTTITVDTTANFGSAPISVTVGNNRTPRRSASIPVTATITAPAFDNGCLYRRPATIEAVPGAEFETLERFPLLIELSGVSWLRSLSNGGLIKYNGDHIDLLAGTVDGLDIPIEHEPGSYDPINGNIVAWVQLPKWNPTQDYTFWLYYHNRLTASIEDLTVWQDYLAINHGGGNGRNPANVDIPWDTSGIVDSSGYVGTGADCSDSASLAAISTPDFLNGLSAFSINLVKKSTATNSSSGVIGTGDLSADGVCPMYVRDGASLNAGSGTTVNSLVVKASVTSGNLRWVGPNGFTETDWQNLLITWRSGEDLTVYADGEVVTKTSAGIARSGVTTFGVGPLVLGRSAQFASFGRWSGEFDEVRFSGIYRSANWAYAEHASWQPGFLTIGAEETPETAVERVVALPDLVRMNVADAFVDIDVLGNDLGTAPLSIDSLTQPTGDARVSVNADGTVRFQLNGALISTRTFTYTPTDGTVTGDPSTVTVIVQGTITGPTTYSISADAPLVVEPVSGITPVKFTITRTGKIDIASSVDWAKTGTTGAADFQSGQAFSGTVLFAPGEQVSSVTLNLISDGLVEGDETVILTLSNPQPDGSGIGSGVAQTTVTGTTQPVVSIAANAVTVYEGTSGEQTVGFTVTRTVDTSGSSSVDWTKSGTTSESDFIYDWWKQPIRSGRDWSSGTAYWYDRTDDPIPAATRFASEEGDVALIDSFSGSSKKQDRGNVSTWDRLIGGPINGSLISIDTQFDWRPSTFFGMGNGLQWLPTGPSYPDGSGWIFWVIQTIPASERTDGGDSSIWDEIIAGTHDAKYLKFGERFVQKVATTGHPLKRFIIDANHEMNQSNPHQVYASTVAKYKAAMERTIDKIREGAGTHIRFCHRPAYRPDSTKIGTYASFAPDNADVYALSIHPGAAVNTSGKIDQLFAGTLNAEWYGTDELITFATGKGKPIAFPEWSPKFEAGGDACPLANTFITKFYNNVLVPNKDIIVCDNIYHQNVRDTGAYEGGDAGGIAQWSSMVATRKTLWYGVGLPPKAGVNPFAGSLTYTTGQTTKSISFGLRGDKIVEGNETITVSLSNPSGCVLGTSSATTTVLDGSGGGGGEFTTPLRTITAATPAELATIIGTPAGQFPAGIVIAGPDRNAPYRAGDMIVLKNGDYGNRTFARSGTATDPIWVKAENKFGVTSATGWTLSGNHVRVWGVDFNGSGINTKLTGNFTRLYRCRIRGIRTPATKAGDFAISYSGNDTGILYCEFYDNDGRGYSGKSDALRPLVYRCYFHDWYNPIAGGDPNGRECVQFGQTQQPDGRPSRRSQFGRLLFNLFVDVYQSAPPTGRAKHDENEPFSNKSSDNEIRGNTFIRSKNLNNRFGDRNLIAQNYIGNGSQIGVYCDGNKIVANNCSTGGFIGIFSGSQYHDQGATGDNVGIPGIYNGDNDYPACRDTFVAGNTGELRVGQNNVSEPTDKFPDRPKVPCKRTTIQGHTGVIRTENNYSGSWDTVSPGYLEENTTYSATSGTTLQPPTKALTATEVGVDAPWIAIPAPLA